MIQSHLGVLHIYNLVYLEKLERVKKGASPVGRA